jgi:hypothetical protein
MPNFKKSKNSTQVPYQQNAFIGAKIAAEKAGKKTFTVDGKEFPLKMDSSHVFKAKPAAMMKTMYMGSTYSMTPMIGDEDDKSNAFKVDIDSDISSKGLFNQFDGSQDNRSIKDIQDEEYKEAQDAFKITGPFNRKILETDKTGTGKFIFVTGDKKPSKTIPPVKNKKVDEVDKTSGGGPALTGSIDIKPDLLGGPSKQKTPLKPSASKEIQAITPRQTRRNERNVKFLKRRVRKAERKGDISASLRQSLANAQAQQAGNFLPGDKFTQPSSGSNYQTPKQVRQGKKRDKVKNKASNILSRLSKKRNNKSNNSSNSNSGFGITGAPFFKKYKN